MPAHLINYLVMLPILAWIIWRRVSRQFGRQPIRRKRMIFRIVVFSIIGAMLALSGLHRAALAEGLLGGVLIGAANHLAALDAAALTGFGALRLGERGGGCGNRHGSTAGDEEGSEGAQTSLHFRILPARVKR